MLIAGGLEGEDGGRAETGMEDGTVGGVNPIEGCFVSLRGFNNGKVGWRG